MKTVEKRRRIVAAALQLFSERGYADTSIADIAAEAGFLKGNLSYYFKTKAEVLESVTEARKQELFDRLEARLYPGIGAPEALEEFLQTVESSAAELARVGCPVGSLCSELSKSDPTLHPYATRILEALRIWLVGQFSRLQPVEAAEDHAEHLLTLMQGTAVLAAAYRDPDLVFRRVKAARAWLRTTLR